MIYKTPIGYISKQGNKYFFSKKPNTDIIQYEWLEISDLLAEGLIHQKDKLKLPIYSDSAIHLLNRIRNARSKQ